MLDAYGGHHEADKIIICVINGLENTDFNV